MEHLETLLHVFIPLFVAINPLEIIPIYIGCTQGLTPDGKKRLTRNAALTAIIIAAVFVVVGRTLFSFIGITQFDFQVGGGIVLLILGVMDLLFSQHEERRKPDETLGVVPIGVPLMIGPAAMTTILILEDNHGYLWTVASLVLNLALVFVMFHYSSTILRVFGKGGTKAFGKVISLFLVAIAVMMIRSGIKGIIDTF